MGGGVKFWKSRLFKKRKVRLSWKVLTEMTLQKRKWRELSWSGKKSLFLNEWCIGLTRSEIESLEIPERLKPRKRTLRWVSYRNFLRIFLKNWNLCAAATFWRSCLLVCAWWKVVLRFISVAKLGDFSPFWGFLNLQG